MSEYIYYNNKFNCCHLQKLILLPQQNKLLLFFYFFYKIDWFLTDSINSLLLKSILKLLN
jgi:hypothetical protein